MAMEMGVSVTALDQVPVQGLVSEKAVDQKPATLTRGFMKGKTIEGPMRGTQELASEKALEVSVMIENPRQGCLPKNIGKKETILWICQAMEKDLVLALAAVGHPVLVEALVKDLESALAVHLELALVKGVALALAVNLELVLAQAQAKALVVHLELV